MRSPPFFNKSLPFSSSPPCNSFGKKSYNSFGQRSYKSSLCLLAVPSFPLHSSHLSLFATHATHLARNPRFYRFPYLSHFLCVFLCLYNASRGALLHHHLLVAAIVDVETKKGTLSRSVSFLC